MKKHILIIPGDGIGPEVTTWGKAVLVQIAVHQGHEFTFEDALMGHVAIEESGSPLPDDTLARAKASDAILFGAVGHTKYDNDPTLKIRPEQGLFRIRKELASILSAVLLIEISFDLKAEAKWIMDAISQVLKQGYRTADIARSTDDQNKILGTKEMGQNVLKSLE